MVLDSLNKNIVYDNSISIYLYDSMFDMYKIIHSIAIIYK